MKFNRFAITASLAIGLDVTAEGALAEEFSVTTFVPLEYHTNTLMFK